MQLCANNERKVTETYSVHLLRFTEYYWRLCTAFTISLHKQQTVQNVPLYAPRWLQDNDS